MHMRSNKHLWIIAIVALMLAAIPGITLGQQASPVGSPVALDAAMVTGNWVARATDLRNGQVDGEPLVGAPEVRWTTELPSDAFLPPAPGDHIVIVHSAAELSALDNLTGEVLWSTPLEASSSAPSLVDGVVYTGAMSGAHAFDARTGEELWSFQATHELEMEPPADSPPQTLIGAPVSVVDGVVYATGGGYGGLWALDAQTGKELWSYDTNGGVPAVASVADGLLYFPSDGLFEVGEMAGVAISQLQAVDTETGMLVWAVDLPAGTTSFTAPVILDNIILIGVSQLEGGIFSGSWQAFNRTTGELQWSVPSVLPPWDGNVTAANGMFFVPGTESTGVFALDAETGATVWQHENNAQVWWGSVIAGDTLYLRTEEPAIEAIDTATGALLWTIPTGEASSWPNSGIAFADGVLYTGTGTSLYAIGGDGGSAPEPGPSTLVSAANVDPNADAFFGWLAAFATPETMQGPEGIAVRPNGEIFVVDSLNDRFQVFDANGNFLRLWGQTGTGPGDFMFHEEDGFYVGDAEFSSDGTFYVVDPGNSRIQVFDTDLNHLRDILLPSDNPEEPLRGQSLAIDEDRGRIYMSEFTQNRFLIFDLEGNLLDEWGTTGPESAMNFSLPGDIVVDSAGQVYVVEGARSKIRVFSPGGEPVAVWGAQGTAPGQTTGPFGLAIDDAGNVYVAEYPGNRIQVFAPDGTVIGSFSAAGSGDSALMNPTFITVTPDGRLLVSDETNNRVVAFTTPMLTTPSATPKASPAA